MGSYLHTADGALVAASLSLYHFVRFSSEARLPDLVGVVVPLSALDEIAKLGAGGGKLTVSDKSIAFETADRRYCSRLVDTAYPVYGNYLPELGETYVDVDRNELLTAVRRLMCIAEAESAIELTFGHNEIIASLNGRGDGHEVVTCTENGPIDALMAVSAARLVEFLEMPKSEVVQLYIYEKKMGMRLCDPNEPDAIIIETTRIPRSMRAAA
jgi:DNA polymerase III sliding clamp (beta) subunit (PCNA family)